MWLYASTFITVVIRKIQTETACCCYIFSRVLKCKAQKRPSQELHRTTLNCCQWDCRLVNCVRRRALSKQHAYPVTKPLLQRNILTKSHAQACSCSTIHMTLCSNRMYIYWSVILIPGTELLKPLEFP